MAVNSVSVSTFSALRSFSACTSTKPTSSSSSFSSLSIPSLSLQKICPRSSRCVSWSWFPTPNVQNSPCRRLRKLRSAEEENPVAEQEGDELPTSQLQEEADGEPSSSTEEPDQQPVTVPVSPSDTLTMFFQADGTLSDGAILEVTKALEDTEGISNLKVQVVEGIASIELTKQTTVQATGVASSLVEIIQGSGFKLQTLNLSFEDEELVTV